MTGVMMSMAPWQLQMLANRPLRLLDVSSDVARGGIDVHVPRQLPVLVADHGWPWRQRDFRQLGERDLGARLGLDEDALQVRQRVTEALFVPHVGNFFKKEQSSTRDIPLNFGRERPPLMSRRLAACHDSGTGQVLRRETHVTRKISRKGGLVGVGCGPPTIAKSAA
jgi:hypothetical protein